MQFQDRDAEILSAIHDYGGVMTKRQIKKKFWPNNTDRVVEKRIGLLHEHGYISWPQDRAEYRARGIPEPIYWLNWRGILDIARQNNVRVLVPSSTGENQMRKLKNSLRKQGIRWLREPDWQRLSHNIAANDFRLSVEQELVQHPSLQLEMWIEESVFDSRPDLVNYDLRKGSGILISKAKEVIPDGYFVITDKQKESRGEPPRARFLLEIDMGNHSNPKFFDQKVAAGAAYISSPQYRARFGVNAGYWLVATTGERRMRNLMKVTSQHAGANAGLFFFAWFGEGMKALKDFKVNPLTDSIWWKVGGNEPQALLS